MYVLIEFPEIQKYQDLTGFEYNSEFSNTEAGSCFVKLSWLKEKLSDREFNLLLHDHLLDYMK